MTTVQQVIDLAKARHWSFNDIQMPDGASVSYLNESQTTILLHAAAKIEPLLGETREILTQLVPGQNGGPTALVAINSNGTPYYTTTVDPGYGIQFNGNGTPFIDTANPMVIDPFGDIGSIPGLPLPTDLLRIIACTVMLDQPGTGADFAERTVEIFDQKAATRLGVGHAGDQAPKAFISANRLVPVRYSDNDTWSLVTSVRLSMLRIPTLTALTDTITLPEPCVHAMIADLTCFLATASRLTSNADKQVFLRAKQEADAVLESDAINIIGSVTVSSVIYRRN